MQKLDVDLLMIVSTIIILIIVLMMVMIYLGFLQKKSKLLLRQKAEQVQFEKELAQTQIEIREQTLTYIGQELHDDLGQKLSVAKLLSNKLISAETPQDRETMQEINTILGECINDVRQIAKTFITETTEHFGLIHSLEVETERLQKLDFVKVHFFYNNDDVDINSKHARILFRIIQECISNALKHSKCKDITISVNDIPDLLEIKISDNGIGVEKHKMKDGSGVKNMQNRAKLINADFELNSVKNEGTEIIIKYPKT